VPQTVIYSTKSEEGTYEAATDAEVADLMATFVAATDALDEATAFADAEYGEHPQYNSDEYKARNAGLAPFSQALATAGRALAASRNLPVGTYVRFASREGWYGSTTDYGMITKVTSTSYTVVKEASYGESKTARISRQHGHEFLSSYSGSNGGRSLSVVRTPAQQAVWIVEEGQRREQQERQNAERRAYNHAVYAADRAKGEQHALLHAARQRALETLIKRHQVEFDGMLGLALDLLASEAPGREETTPPALPTA
jgi:hypothetical protein